MMDYLRKRKISKNKKKEKLRIYILNDWNDFIFYARIKELLNKVLKFPKKSYFPLLLKLHRKLQNYHFDCIGFKVEQFLFC